MTNEFTGTINREYKDRLFKLIFRNKGGHIYVFNRV